MSRFILILISFFLFTCDFTPRGEVLTPVPVPDLSDVNIAINYPDDTIKIFQDREIVYSVNGKEVELAATAIILKADTLQIDQSSKGKFTIAVNTLGTGNYPLRIYSNFTIRTKNLADVALNEYYSVAHNWQVMVDIDPPGPVQVTNIETVNGLPVIHWEKYTRINFQNYQLVRKCYNSSNQSYVACQFQEIADQNTLSFSDSQYKGGPVEYYISVTASYQTADGNPVQYP